MVGTAGPSRPHHDILEQWTIRNENAFRMKLRSASCRRKRPSSSRSARAPAGRMIWFAAIAQPRCLMLSDIGRKAAFGGAVYSSSCRIMCTG